MSGAGLLRFYLTTTGRISLQATWLAVVIPFAALGIAAYLIDRFFWPEIELEHWGNIYTPVSGVVMIALLWPGFATSIRRFHDLNMTGWWVLILLPSYLWIPDFTNFLESGAVEKTSIVVWVSTMIATFVLSLVQLMVPGTRGANRFGSDPREAAK